MSAFVDNIEDLALKNDNFRKVIFTGEHSQLVLMSLKPGEDIGLEVHDHVDQFFRVEAGEGKLFIDGVTHELRNGTGMVVPAGSEHNLLNSGTADLKLYTIYSPANHPRGTIHHSRAEAKEAEAQHD